MVKSTKGIRAIISSLLAVVIAITAIVVYRVTVIASPAETVQTNRVPVFVDDSPITYGNARVVDGTTYVPVNPVFEKMGFKAKYDAKTMKLEITKGTDSITIDLTANTISGTMTVKGKQKSISAFISNSIKEEGVALIPVRSIADNLYCETVWDGTNVWIYSQDYQGEKKTEGLKEVNVETIDAYLTAITQILSKQDTSCRVDHLKLSESLDKKVIEFHNALNNFLTLARTGGYEKNNTNYQSIVTDPNSSDWKKVDTLASSVLILHRNISRLALYNIIDNKDSLNVIINEIYSKARSN